MIRKKNIAILGSTGSIGTQALEVIRSNPDYFEVEVLTAQNNADLLIIQAIEFKPNVVVIQNELLFEYVNSALSDIDVKVYCGSRALAEVVKMESIDVVITALVGYSGLIPTIEAIKSGKTIALANKETLVVAGEMIKQLVEQYKVKIFPVDSEHSAIFQCLVGEYNNPIEKLILTASGGPFRGKNADYLRSVDKTHALKHPNWSMGKKITIDSSTLMNKGLEVIEAKWLFDVAPSQIEVIVHPQSIIHSLVQFSDGSIKAQMGLPDMKLPIQYAITYPDRFSSDFPRFDFRNYASLTFESPDMKTFRCLELAYEALRKGGNVPCVLNAANEVAVEAFLNDKIGFLEIADIIDLTMQRVAYQKTADLQVYIETNEEARAIANEITNKFLV